MSQRIKHAMEEILAKKEREDEWLPKRNITLRVSGATYVVLEEVAEKLGLTVTGAAQEILHPALADVCEFLGIDWDNHPAVLEELRALYPSMKFGDEAKGKK